MAASLVFPRDFLIPGPTFRALPLPLGCPVHPQHKGFCPVLLYLYNRLPGSTLSNVELSALGCSLDSCMSGALRHDTDCQGTELWKEM